MLVLWLQVREALAGTFSLRNFSSNRTRVNIVHATPASSLENKIHS